MVVYSKVGPPTQLLELIQIQAVLATSLGTFNCVYIAVHVPVAF